ncbi:MAG TPA: hypothetical protein VLT17_09665 [Gemmatimonadales bacterium]|nr:hypothetical protein [Gemmatimonadales bacterium]
MRQVLSRMHGRCSALAVVALAGTIAATTAANLQAQDNAPPKLPANLIATRAALEKYQDPVAAVRDGYLSTLACVDFPKGSTAEGMMPYKPGGMGVHFLNPALIGPKLDSLKPQVLIYEPVGNRLKLVAAEWFVPTAVSKEAPMIFGKKLDGPMEGHAPLLPPELHHWDLHVWLWKANPNGVMHPTNSAVKCPDGPYSFHEEATKMVMH